MKDFYIDANRDRFGVEPICRVLPIAPATYYGRRMMSTYGRRMMSTACTTMTSPSTW
jgi:hypothetical protein